MSRQLKFESPQFMKIYPIACCVSLWRKAKCAAYAFHLEGKYIDLCLQIIPIRPRWIDFNAIEINHSCDWNKKIPHEQCVCKGAADLIQGLDGNPAELGVGLVTNTLHWSLLPASDLSLPNPLGWRKSCFIHQAYQQCSTYISIMIEVAVEIFRPWDAMVSKTKSVLYQTFDKFSNTFGYTLYNCVRVAQANYHARPAWFQHHSNWFQWTLASDQWNKFTSPSAEAAFPLRQARVQMTLKTKNNTLQNVPHSYIPPETISHMNRLGYALNTTNYLY